MLFWGVVSLGLIVTALVVVLAGFLAVSMIVGGVQGLSKKMASRFRPSNGKGPG